MFKLNRRGELIECLERLNFIDFTVRPKRGGETNKKGESFTVKMGGSTKVAFGPTGEIKKRCR